MYIVNLIINYFAFNTVEALMEGSSRHKASTQNSGDEEINADSKMNIESIITTGTGE